MKQKKILSFLICLLGVLGPNLVLAGGGEGIPLGFLLSQVFNFFLFALILFLILRKKAPAFLKQKRSDFLEYRKKAQALKQKQQADCLALQQKIQYIETKQSQTKEEVAKALDRDKKELAQQMEHQINILKTSKEQALNRQRLKEVHRLKTMLLSQVMENTSQQISQESEKLKLYDQHVIQKWEQKI